MSFTKGDAVILRGKHPGTVLTPDRGDGGTFVLLASGTRCTFPTADLAPAANVPTGRHDDAATLLPDTDSAQEVPF